jgi:oxygen-independent coproporphyrinogen-3 oxidase
MPDARNATFCSPRAAYIHVPFCRHRCGYCNFTVIAGREDLTKTYLEAIGKELAELKQPKEVDTIFLGGGTPTHMNVNELGQLLTLINHWFPLCQQGEFTSEANPKDLTAEKLQLLAEHRVNRLSLGVQSFNKDKLQLLERDHDAETVALVLQLARPLFHSLSLDLIFAAPGETVATWEADLIAATASKPDHISTYNLTFEKGTHFWTRRQKGELLAAEEDAEAEMYSSAIGALTAAGLEHYEVSNFARPGHACRHNQAYWQGESYFGIGPGATRFIAGERATNHRSTITYLRRMQAGQDPTAEREILSPEEAAREKFVFALRMLPVASLDARSGGVEKAWFAKKTGFHVDELLGTQLEELTSLGLLVQTPDRVFLSDRGLFLADSVFAELLV